MTLAPAVGRPLNGSRCSEKYCLQTREKSGLGLKAERRPAMAREPVSEPCRGPGGEQTYRVKEGCSEEGRGGSAVRCQLGGELTFDFETSVARPARWRVVMNMGKRLD